MTEGVRYPTLAFITGGAGQANDGIPPQPFETFCYDSALLEAKIENFNVVPYTSVLPKELYGNIVEVDKGLYELNHRYITLRFNVYEEGKYTTFTFNTLFITQNVV